MGKDRTGLLLALLLEAIGGRREELADDYGLSSVRLAERLANWAGEGLSERQQMLRRQLMDSRGEQLLAVLEHVDERYGGPRDYLIANGVQDVELDRLKARLRGPALS
jgi:protein tyrosine/serine phosphatase